MTSASTLLVFVFVGVAAVAQAGLMDNLVKTVEGLDLLEDSVRPDLLANFSSFCQKNGRKFNDVSEMRQRLNNFRANKDRVQLRQERERGTARHGLTKFADFTPEEFVKSFTGHRKSSTADKEARKLKSRKPAQAPKGAHNNFTEGGRVKRALPTNFDWRNYGVVSSVKDQGSCGNCYSFASTAMIESSYSLYYGLSGSAVPNYAEAETTDCSTGNYGCNGGWGYKCVQYVMSKPGITTEAAYPFNANAAHNSCKLPSNSPRNAKTLAGYWMQSSEAEIAQDLYDYGPIDISIDANFLDTYQSGILDPQKPAGGWDVNHEVLLVGFGRDSATGKDFWIAKNSWNTNWGENGYFRFARGKNCLDILNEPVSIWFDTSA